MVGYVSRDLFCGIASYFLLYWSCLLLYSILELFGWICIQISILWYSQLFATIYWSCLVGYVSRDLFWPRSLLSRVLSAAKILHPERKTLWSRTREREGGGSCFAYSLSLPLFPPSLSLFLPCFLYKPILWIIPFLFQQSQHFLSHFLSSLIS